MQSISIDKIIDMLQFVEHQAGMRNIISHEYAATDPEMIFNTVKQDIVPLREEVIKIEKDLSALL